MASGSFNIARTSGSSYLSFRVNWSSTPNTPGNYSDITVAVYVDKSSASTSPTWGTSNTSVSVEGQPQEENGLGFSVSPGSSTLLFAKAGYRVYHNDNGSKKTTISVSVGGDVMSASGSSEITLDTIARASSIAVGNYNLGQNISIVIGKKDNSFTSTLSYWIGTQSGTIVNKTSSSTYVWEMSKELIDAIKKISPNSKNVSATVYCETFSGNTKIGDTQSANFTLVITDKPTINNVLMAETIELISQYTTAIIKYLSAPKFTITATPSIGTNISKYVVKVGDRESNGTSNEITINNIQYSYLVDNVKKTKFIINVIDSRGNMSDDYELESDFIEYVNLAFNNTDLKLTRINSVSNFIKTYITGYVYNGLVGETSNVLTLKYRYKVRNDSTAEWSELKSITPTLNEDNTFLIDNIQLDDEFDYKKNYDIEFYAEDLFLLEKYETIIKTSETIVKVHKKGMYIKEIDTTKILVNGDDVFNIDKVYPIGSLYLTVDNSNPKDLFGGTWEKLEEETFLMTASTTYPVKSKGGSNSKTLSISNMPVHSHGQNVLANAGTGSINGRRNYVADESNLSSYSNGIDTMQTGGGQAFDVRPKFYAVYIWIRVS